MVTLPVTKTRRVIDFQAHFSTSNSSCTSLSFIVLILKVLVYFKQLNVLLLPYLTSAPQLDLPTAAELIKNIMILSCKITIYSGKLKISFV